MSLFSGFDLATTDPTTAAGFRLHRLEWLNWGTFNHKVFHLDLHGSNTLLTGDIGSGKSTVVDAISTLLLRADRISFNKAAGAQARERDLRSYVQGHWKSERSETTGRSRPVALRPGTTYTVLLAVFRNAELDQDVTLAQVFWFAGHREGQPERFYAVAVGRRLGIVEDFTDFGSKVATVRRRLRSAGVLVSDTFADYERAYRRALGIPSAQAMELFHQTVSMKSVGNLNDFVRLHMLEPFDAAASVAKLVTHFENLTAAHDAVVAARTQLERLAPILEACDHYDRLGRRLVDLEAERAAVRVVAARMRRNLLVTERDNYLRTLQVLDAELVVANAEVNHLRDTEQGLREARAGFGNGRLGQIEALVAEKSRTRDERRGRATRFAEDLTAAGLEPVTSGDHLPARHAAAETARSRLDEQADALDEQVAQAQAGYRDLDQQARALKDELASLRQRRSNIPLRLIDLRQRLCDGIGVGPADLPFVGELIQVRADENRWQGAAERVLRGFGLSLAVREQHYRQVSSWINDNHLGDRLVYLRVGGVRRRSPVAQSEGQTLDRKLEVSDTDLRPWLAAELQARAGHVCVETMAEFRRCERAVTVAGQVKSGDRHEKDDRRRVDDPSGYVLGWSNAQKVDALLARASAVHADRQQAAADLATATGQRKALLGRRTALEAVIRADLAAIDWWSVTAEITTLEQEKATLEASSAELHRIADELARVARQLLDRQAAVTDLHKRQGSITDRWERAERDLADLGDVDTSFETLDPTIADRAHTRLGSLTTAADCVSATANAVEAIGDEQRRVTHRQGEYATRAGRLMGGFRLDFPTLTTETDDSVASAREYRELARRLAADDLPRFEADFKRALNKETINELAGFNAQLRRQQDTIRERVLRINESLQDIDYNEGTYIALVAADTPNTDIRDFRTKLKDCTSDIIGDHDDQYSERKFVQVRDLISRFTGREGSSEADRAWTRHVTDVRNWFVFSGSERFQETDEEREAFADSDGKSGGQKEKLAYTILAASLAYQFKLDPTAGETRTFRFAVIDEAFGRGSDPSTRYALELFGTFGLQLLVVTPLQKVQVIEPYVSHVGYVSNPGGGASALLNMTIGEYRENRRAHAVRAAATLAGTTAQVSR